MHDHLRTILNDKEAGCRDAFTKERGWEFFHSFYGNRDKAIPQCNPRTPNLVKFVVPNDFVEPMLLRDLEKEYYILRRMVRTTKGYVLLDISLEAIIQCFDLDNSALTSINKDILKRDYENKRDMYRKDFVPHFMRKVYKDSQIMSYHLKGSPPSLTALSPILLKPIMHWGRSLELIVGSPNRQLIL